MMSTLLRKPPEWRTGGPCARKKDLGRFEINGPSRGLLDESRQFRYRPLILPYTLALSLHPGAGHQTRCYEFSALHIMYSPLDADSPPQSALFSVRSSNPVADQRLITVSVWVDWRNT